MFEYLTWPASIELDGLNGQLHGEGAKVIITEADGTMLAVVRFD